MSGHSFTTRNAQNTASNTTARNRKELTRYQTELSDDVAALPVPMYRGNAARTGENPGQPPEADAQMVEGWTRNHRGMVNGSAAVVGGTVFVSWGDSNTPITGVFSALDAETGNEKWSFGNDTPFHSTAAVADGVVYVGSYHGYLHALDAETGTELWRFTGGSSINNDPAVNEGTVYVTSSDDYLYAIDTATGLEIWRFALGSSSMRSAPAVDSATVYVGSWAAHTLYAVDSATGMEKWHYEDDSRLPQTPVVVDGRVYVLTETGSVVALNASTGDVTWRFDSGDYGSSTDAVVSNGVLYYFAGTDIIAISTTDGSERWRAYHGTNCSLTIAGDTLFAGTGRGLLVAIDSSTGSELWSYEIEGFFDVGYPTVYNQAVYVGNSGGAFYAIGDFEPTVSTEETSAIEFYTSVVIEDVILRPLPGALDYEVATIPAGSEVNLGAYPSTYLVDGAYWVSVTFEVYPGGYILLSALDPVTLPPELAELVSNSVEESQDADQNPGSTDEGSGYSVLVADVETMTRPSLDYGTVTGEATAGTEVEVQTSHAGIDYVEGMEWVNIHVVRDGVPGEPIGWIPLSAVDPATLPPDLKANYSTLISDVVVMSQSGNEGTQVGSAEAGQKLVVSPMSKETVDGVDWIEVYVYDEDLRGWIPLSTVDPATLPSNFRQD